MATHTPTRDRFADHPERLTPDAYPALRTMSAGPLFKAVIVPRGEPTPAEFVYIPCSERDDGTLNSLMTWNLLWECGHIRPENLASKLPAKVRALADRYPEQSFRFVPFSRNVSKAFAFESLRALLPLDVLKRFGLSPRVCVWPCVVPEQAESANELERLTQAFAFHIWPHLCSGSPQSAFSRTEPLSLLAHGLDFWLPYLDLLIQRRVRARGRVPFKNDEERQAHESYARQVPPELDADLLRPCFGTDIWDGEEEARDATLDMIEMADNRGKLRALVDAVRSNRVEEDFSSRWSPAREDFERKLYKKRSKVRVSFVELDQTPAVFAPDAEVDIEHRLLWQNLFAVLNAKERHVIVCLRNGSTTKTEIAQELGYANHSPISKALASIRLKAQKLLS